MTCVYGLATLNYLQDHSDISQTETNQNELILKYLIDFSCNEAIMVETANVQKEILNILRMCLEPNALSIIHHLQRGC